MNLKLSFEVEAQFCELVTWFHDFKQRITAKLIYRRAEFAEIQHMLQEEQKFVGELESKDHLFRAVGTMLSKLAASFSRFSLPSWSETELTTLNHSTSTLNLTARDAPISNIPPRSSSPIVKLVRILEEASVQLPRERDLLVSCLKRRQTRCGQYQA
ncbi:unnamed protein product [Protopolystoma xenopodis]|uniref:Uncharacterized protein n=1 Tax=Protopolystoma xenopodis TaxID=117903 RepID=A0A3S4ZIH9_9PLAT|nr:unnamed protein product [Protopolystoma xenopodis]